MSTPVPSCPAAVLIEREAAPNAWEDWRFRVVDVLAGDAALAAGGAVPVAEGLDGAPALPPGATPSCRTLRDDGRLQLTLHPGFEVTLHRDEAEGYFLNLSSGAPVWFVMWRLDDADASRAWPERVTLSYNEAGRLMDAQERVDSCPLPVSVAAWLQDYVDANYRPEPKRRRRPASFQAPGER